MGKAITTFVMLAAIILTITACNSAEVNVLQSTEFRWQSFEWVPLESGGITYEKAYLMVPIQFAGSGRTFRLQLDTAAYSRIPNLFFDSIGVQHKVVKRGDGYRVVEFSGKIAGYDMKKIWFPVRDTEGSVPAVIEDNSTIGTLGLDFFKDKILILDFLNKRLAIVAEVEQLPTDLINRARFFPAEVNENWFQLKLIAGATTLNLGYDTGSSLFPFVVDKDTWGGVTGKDGDELENKRVEAGSWGRPVTIVGAPTKDEVRLGDLSLGYPHVYFDATSTVVFHRTIVDGVMGNALFYDRHIVIIDSIGKRFGVVDTQVP